MGAGIENVKKCDGILKGLVSCYRGFFKFYQFLTGKYSFVMFYLCNFTNQSLDNHHNSLYER